MVEDNASARSPFKATDLVWENLSNLFRERLAREGTARVESQSFNASFASYPRNDRRYQRFATHLGDHNGCYDRACELYCSALRGEILDRTHLSAASIESGMATKVNDKWVTWDYLLSVEEVMTMVSVEPRLLNEPLTVVDLGSGWGRVGHVLMTLNPRLTYVACDIPESLLIAQEYLPQHLPDTFVCPYSVNRTVPRFTRELLGTGGIRFCGTQDLDRFDDSSIDVFINVFSFQEMTMQQVIEYFTIIDRTTKGGIFYNQQRLRGDVLTRENFPYPPEWVKLLDRLAVFSPSYFETAMRV